MSGDRAATTMQRIPMAKVISRNKFPALSKAIWKFSRFPNLRFFLPSVGWWISISCLWIPRFLQRFRCRLISSSINTPTPTGAATAPRIKSMKPVTWSASHRPCSLTFKVVKNLRPSGGIATVTSPTVSSKHPIPRRIRPATIFSLIASLLQSKHVVGCEVFLTRRLYHAISSIGFYLWIWGK